MQLNLPDPEHITLVCDGADWSTSPRAYHARWSIQSPDSQMGEVVDQSPSARRSVVGIIDQDVNLADWSTRPRACHARWSVQSIEMSK